MKVLIENAVPLNNGDAALIFSIGQEFENRGDTVYYSTFHYQKVKRKYPEKNWIKSPLTKRRITKIPVINTIYLSLLLLINPLFKKFDAVISAPGGYINSFYGIEKKLLLLNLYRKVLKKPIYMYSQSIGPLDEKDKKRLKKAMNDFNLFYVRDDRSMERINELGVFC
ncbi:MULTISPECIES: polysaccharide pyruvyl transferase family protein [unclassified Enterococcus]|jgi:colanic acid/amylovoran biosynthesis protein|uniref:polysaccharide pyruvyl transferase family protein n=1 Tax=unclassified Enterococcus TaxID=2608891 RepID=UPI003D2919C2